MPTRTKTAWRTVRLGDIIDVYGGGTPATGSASYWNGSIPWLTPAELTGGSDRFIENTRRMITDEGLKNSSARLMPQDSILLTSRATIGEVAINKKPMATNQGFINIDPKEIDKMFLFYWLRGNKTLLKQHATGSTFLEISKSVFKTLHISLPEKIDEQKRIGNVLSVFDEKIENNNRTIKTHEEIAQTIFKEWFVNFRFPGHEKVGFIDSSLGKIPKGWRVKKFSDIANLNRGVSYSSKDISAKSGGLPMINLANFLRGGGFNADGVKHYTGEYKDSHLVKPGQIVIAMTDLTSNREVIGHPARIPEDFNKAVISLDVCSISTEDLYVEFLYSLMLRKSFAQLMAGSASGTNVSHLSKTNIEEYELVFPDKGVLIKFNEFIRPIFTQQINLAAENRRLIAMRDLLLPRLMSGELQV